MSLVQNEQTKLIATYLNGIAIALFGIGGLAPTLAYVFGSISGGPSSTIAAAAILRVTISAALHMVARRILRDLRA
jgi:hypothetical protein